MPYKFPSLRAFIDRTTRRHVAAVTVGLAALIAVGFGSQVVVASLLRQPVAVPIAVPAIPETHTAPVVAAATEPAEWVSARLAETSPIAARVSARRVLRSRPATVAPVTAPSSSAAARASSRSLMDVLGMGAEGQVLTVRNGKVTWEYPVQPGPGRLPASYRGTISDGGSPNRGGGGSAAPAAEDGQVETHDHQNGVGGSVLDVNAATFGVLQVARGGTGLATYASGSLLVGQGNGGLAPLSLGTDGKILTVTNGSPAWESVGYIINIPGDQRYVNQSGDTMTGTLVLEPSSGLALNARGTISGSLITQNGAGSNYYMGNLGIGTSQPGATLQVAGNILNTPTAITVTGSGSTGAGPQAQMFVSGNYAYVPLEGSDQLQIFDVSNSIPVSVSTTQLTNPWGVFVAGRYAYVGRDTFGSAKLEIIDISNPTTPVAVGSVAVSGAESVYVSGKYAYVGNGASTGFSVVDVSNPSDPTVVYNGGSYKGYFITVSGNYLYLVTGWAGTTLAIYNIANPTNPTLVSTATTGSYPSSVAVSGKYVYVSNLLSQTLQILDVSNPANPTSVATVSTGTDSYPRDVKIYGRYAYLFGDMGVKAYDVSDVSNVSLVASNSSAGSLWTGFVTGDAIITTGYYSNSIYKLKMSGLDTPTSNIGSLDAGNISVAKNIDARGHLNVLGGINVGTDGIDSQGPVGVYSVSGNNALSVIASNAGRTSTLDAVSVKNLATSATSSIIKSGLNIQSTGSWSGSLSTNIGLYISSVSGGTNNYDAIFNGGGNVGIGTIAPETKLEVVGTISGSTLFGSNGVTTKVVAGACSDSNVQNTNGTMCVDSSNGRIYFRYGGAWHYAAQTAGFQIPKMTRNGKDETEGLSVGDPVVGRIDEVMEDGALHGVWEKLNIAEEVRAALRDNPDLLAQVGTGTSSEALTSNDIAYLTVQGSLTVLGGAIVRGDLDVQGRLFVGTEQVGTARVLQGQDSLTVEFERPWPNAPIVDVIPDWPVVLGVTERTTTGFTVRFAEPIPRDITVSWFALSSSSTGEAAVQPTSTLTTDGLSGTSGNTSPSGSEESTPSLGSDAEQPTPTTDGSSPTSENTSPSGSPVSTPSLAPDAEQSPSTPTTDAPSDTPENTSPSGSEEAAPPLGSDPEAPTVSSDPSPTPAPAPVPTTDAPVSTSTDNGSSETAAPSTPASPAAE